MRMSRLIGTTLRETPAGAETLGYQLLLRAGFVRQLGQGIFSYLPLAWRVMGKIEQILREEMDASGGVELSMPVTNPAEIWQRSGRYQAIGPELARFADRRDRPMVLAMTHEEVVATLAASEINSWRQLPKLVYQIQIKFRDDPRPRAGLIRTREFTMKDAYTLDRDEAGLDRQYNRLHAAYTEIFRRCGLPAIAVASDVGMMGGSEAHEFMYLNAVGEDTIVLCDECGYAQNRQVAQSARPGIGPEEPVALERVETPDADTIEKLVRLVGVSEERTAKAVFMATSDDRFVVAVVRGDMQLNETKLANAVSASELRPMTPEEILSIGCVPGYASPIGVGDRAIVAVDDLVAESANLISGANETGWHLKNVNVHRDYEPDIVLDLVAVEDGQPCVVCRSPLRSERAVEVGNIFKLGTKYSAAMNAKFLDEDGAEKPIVMGSYGIGVGRLLACVAEEHRDDRGLVWPSSIAPYTAHICALGEDGLSRSEEVAEALEAAGIEYLLDDRQERPGVQFADAELIGCPVQLTVSRRSIEQGGVEAKLRTDAGRAGQTLSVGEVGAWIESHVLA
ncbi:MAG: proline--tRNA ligase [Acidimicrobiales bacterium]